MRVLALLALAFGVLTIRAGGSVLFGGEAAQRAAGAYVPFVLWFNFCAGFVYLAASVGLWLQRRWAVALALGIAVATMLVFTAFGVFVLQGGPFEWRTVVAMSVRSLFWAVLAWIAYRGIWRFSASVRWPRR